MAYGDLKTGKSNKEFKATMQRLNDSGRRILFNNMKRNAARKEFHDYLWRKHCDYLYL